MDKLAKIDALNKKKEEERAKKLNKSIPKSKTYQERLDECKKNSKTPSSTGKFTKRHENIIAMLKKVNEHIKTNKLVTQQLKGYMSASGPLTQCLNPSSDTPWLGNIACTPYFVQSSSTGWGPIKCQIKQEDGSLEGDRVYYVFAAINGKVPRVGKCENAGGGGEDIWTCFDNTVVKESSKFFFVKSKSDIQTGRTSDGDLVRYTDQVSVHSSEGRLARCYRSDKYCDYDEDYYRLGCDDSSLSWNKRKGCARDNHNGGFDLIRFNPSEEAATDNLKWTNRMTVMAGDRITFNVCMKNGRLHGRDRAVNGCTSYTWGPSEGGGNADRKRISIVEGTVPYRIVPFIGMLNKSPLGEYNNLSQTAAAQVQRLAAKKLDIEKMREAFCIKNDTLDVNSRTLEAEIEEDSLPPEPKNPKEPKRICPNMEGLSPNWLNQYMERIILQKTQLLLIKKNLEHEYVQLKKTVENVRLTEEERKQAINNQCKKAAKIPTASDLYNKYKKDIPKQKTLTETMKETNDLVKAIRGKKKETPEMCPNNDRWCLIIKKQKERKIKEIEQENIEKGIEGEGEENGWKKVQELKRDPVVKGKEEPEEPEPEEAEEPEEPEPEPERTVLPVKKELEPLDTVPSKPPADPKFPLPLILVLSGLLVGLIVYFMFFRTKHTSPQPPPMRYQPPPPPPPQMRYQPPPPPPPPMRYPPPPPPPQMRYPPPPPPPMSYPPR